MRLVVIAHVIICAIVLAEPGARDSNPHENMSQENTKRTRPVSASQQGSSVVVDDASVEWTSEEDPSILEILKNISDRNKDRSHFWNLWTVRLHRFLLQRLVREGAPMREIDILDASFDELETGGMSKQWWPDKTKLERRGTWYTLGSVLLSPGCFNSQEASRGIRVCKNNFYVFFLPRDQEPLMKNEQFWAEFEISTRRPVKSEGPRFESGGGVRQKSWQTQCAPSARALRERIAGSGLRNAGGLRGGGPREFVDACRKMIE